MNEESDKSLPFSDLAAHMDGELTGPAAARLRAALKDDPQLQARISEQERLRAALKSVLCTDAPPVTAELQQRIDALLVRSAPVEKHAPQRTKAPRPHMSWQLRWRQHWSAGAVAAMVAILLLVIWQVSSPSAPQPRPDAVVYAPLESPVATILNANQVQSMTQRHRGCASMQEQIANAANFPARIEEVPASVGNYLGNVTYPALDLTPIGYEFWKAGPCESPGRTAVHLLYRPIQRQPGDDHAISLWISKDTGCNKRFPCDKLYPISSPESPHPILVWRHEGLLYFLTGDIDPQVQSAYRRIAMAQ